MAQATAKAKKQKNSRSSASTAHSSAATLASPQAPQIVREPQSKSVPENKRVVLRIRATGNPAPHYQWLHNGVVMEGENSPALVITHLQQYHEGVYTCDVRNSEGAAYSQKAFVKISTATEITPSLNIEEYPSMANEEATLVFLLEGIPAEAFPFISVRWYCDGQLFHRGREDFLELSKKAMVKGRYHAVIATCEGRKKTNTVDTTPIVARIEEMEAPPELTTAPALPVESFISPTSASPNASERKKIFLETFLHAWKSNAADHQSNAREKKTRFLKKALEHFESKNEKKSRSNAA